jgi:hypothetical protein
MTRRSRSSAGPIGRSLPVSYVAVIGLASGGLSAANLEDTRAKSQAGPIDNGDLPCLSVLGITNRLSHPGKPKMSGSSVKDQLGIQNTSEYTANTLRF